ncbi:MAG: tyrosine--tRNA ligase [Rhodospirillaceae bacterium]|jgi:tyrosyl-tRNA synthetase|nr:tyrosine--tRNA ligase [Rhodospirillaceae bacterium]
MTILRSDFLRTIVDRGFLHQCTDLRGLDDHMANNSTTAYIGFDCTADSLHIGSLLPIMLLRHLQNCDHKPIVLIGGGTTKIGDPSGKNAARKLLSDDEILHNMNSIKKIFDKFLKFGDCLTDAVIVNNADWLDSINYISFLRDFGKYFSINRMLNFDSVKLRLKREQQLSFLEFNYMILQAYDFLKLSHHYKCTLQIGGSDQWGNIVNGVELGRRIDGRNLFGLTIPLMTTASGSKMGKTADGAVWITDRLSPWNYWQFWRNTKDTDVERFLKLFTELPLDEIKRLSNLKETDINYAKKILANEATRLAHGTIAATQAAKTAEQTFEDNSSIAEGLPTIMISTTELDNGIHAFILFTMAGLATSNSEARRLIKNGGAKINNDVVNNETELICTTHIKNGFIKLSAGKKRHILIKTQM